MRGRLAAVLLPDRRYLGLDLGAASAHTYSLPASRPTGGQLPHLGEVTLTAIYIPFGHDGGTALQP